MNQAKDLSLLNHLLYLIFFTSLISSFRVISSISIGLILVIGIITNRSDIKVLFQWRAKNLFLAGCILFFLLHVISLIYTHNMQEGWNDLRIKTGLLLTPFAVCYSGYLKGNKLQKLSLHFCLLLAGACLYCLGMAVFHYSQTNEFSVFFYHTLVSPLKQHAIYFSILVFIALVFLFENIRKNDARISKSITIFFVIFFSGFLFLLSSKLVIAFYLLYLLYYFIGFIKNSTINKTAGIGVLLLFISIGSLVFINHNPVSKRFDEILKGDIQLVTKDRFDPGDYFNGLQFRLLQWRFVTGILRKNQSWPLGVSPGDAQYYLDQKYISKNMYIGDPVRGDRGFLGYNTHNQFLETLLQTGITGLFILLLICFSLLRMAWKKKSRGASFIIILLLAWLLNESVFETQYGILIFTFFPFMSTDFTE